MKSKEKAKMSYSQRRGIIQVSGALGILLLFTGFKYGLVNYVNSYESFIVLMLIFNVTGILMLFGLFRSLKWLYTNAYHDGLKIDDFKWHKWEKF